MVYLVSYDLNTPGKYYADLIKAIKTYNGWCQVLSSQWFVCHNGSAEDVEKHLRQFMGNNDRLLVCELTQNHQGWLDQEVIDWLKKHL